MPVRDVTGTPAARPSAGPPEPLVPKNLLRETGQDRRIRQLMGDVAQVAHGATATGADEIVGFLRSMRTGRPWEEERQAYHDLMEQGTFPPIVGELGGAALTGGLLPLARTAGGVMGQAALAGGITGFLGEGTVQERARDALVGGLTAAPLAGMARGIGSAISRRRARKAAGMTAPQAAAADQLRKAAEQMDVTMLQAIQGARDLGRGATLGMARPFHPVARNVAQRSSYGKRLGEEAYEAIEEMAPEEFTAIMTGMKQFPGDPKKFFQMVESNLQTKGNKLYAAARAQPDLVTTVSLEDALKQPDVANIIRKQKGMVSLRDQPMTSVDRLMRVYRRLGEKARGQGAAKSDLKEQRDALLQAITDQRPEYGQAVRYWAHQKELQDAFVEGRKAFSQWPEDVQRILDGYAPHEQKAYVTGLIRAGEQMLTSGEDIGKTIQNAKLLLQGKRAPVLKQVLGEEAFKEVQSQLRRFIDIGRARGATMGGSPTFQSQAIEQERLWQLGRGAQAARQLAGGNILGALGTAVSPRNMARMNPRVERAVAETLYRPVEDVAPGLLQRESIRQGFQGLPLMMGRGAVPTGVATGLLSQ